MEGRRRSPEASGWGKWEGKREREQDHSLKGRWHLKEHTGSRGCLMEGTFLVGCECVKTKSTNCQDFTFQSATSNLCLQQQIAFESRVYLSLHGEMAKSRLLSYSLGGNLINHATWD